MIVYFDKLKVNRLQILSSSDIFALFYFARRCSIYPFDTVWNWFLGLKAKKNVPLKIIRDSRARNIYQMLLTKRDANISIYSVYGVSFQNFPIWILNFSDSPFHRISSIFLTENYSFATLLTHRICFFFNASTKLVQICLSRESQLSLRIHSFHRTNLNPGLGEVNLHRQILSREDIRIMCLRKRWLQFL